MYNKQKKGVVGYYDGERISTKYQTDLNHFRRQLVKKQTPAEKFFEENIAKLVREEAQTYYIPQRIFYITDGVAFITDFYFKKFKVVVEVDGPRHFYGRDKERDEWRDRLLLDHAGVSVVRFSNNAVLKRRNDVFSQTVRFLATTKNATPSHQKFLRKVYSDLLIDA